MNPKSLSHRPCPAQLLRVTAIILAVLAWHSPALCGEIHDAARSGDLGKVKALLKANPDLVSSSDTNQYTPLLWAARCDHPKVAEWLLANQADVNATNNYGVTALHLAAADGYPRLAALLLAHNAGVNARNSSGETPLHLSAVKGNTDVAVLLLSSNANVNAADNNGRTPLHWAAALGNKDMADLLIDNRANVNVKDNLVVRLCTWRLPTRRMAWCVWSMTPARCDGRTATFWRWRNCCWSTKPTLMPRTTTA